MKKKSIFITLIFLLIGIVGFSQDARIQVIHNSSDTDAEVVDVYLNDALVIDDFAFRTAFGFTDYPAGSVDIEIAPSNSTDVNDAIYTKTVSLTANETYVVVANGLLDGTGADAFDLYLYDMGEETAAAGETDVLVFHGATDAPTVDVYESKQANATIVDNLAYGAFQGYLNLTTLDYRLQIQDETGSVVVASYEAPLQTLMLEETAITVVASGFLSPGAGDPAFGLWVALPSGGDLVELPTSISNVQVIHNSADTDANMVDVYLNDELLLDDFMFRTATPFLEVNAGVDTKIDIAPYTSGSVSESIYNLTVALDADKDYILVANGLLDGAGDEAFELYVYDMAMIPEEDDKAFSESKEKTTTDILVFHGATDAPTVDVYESRLANATIVDNLAYGEFDGYLNLSTLDYRLEIQDETGSVVVASYEALLETLNLEGQAITVLASGFLNPGMDEAAFGLFVALANGGDLVELPSSVSNVQVIHNSADTDAYMVDVYLNDELLLDDFMFRTATEFVELNAGVDTKIDIAPYTSESVSESIYSLTVALDSDKDYILVANGLLDGEKNEAFDLYVYDMAKQDAGTDMTDVLVFHGATDAPTVDVFESSVPAGTIVDDLAYGDFAGYLPLSTLDYRLEIQDETGAVVVASYEAPLQTLMLEETAITVLASGFLSPGVDEAAFGLWVALPTGGDLVELPTSVSNVQVIHNSADLNAELVDVYLNNEILLDDFMFRTATEFVELNAGVDTKIDIAPYTSESVEESIYSLTVALDGGKDYILVANGLLDGTGDDAFGIFAFDMAKQDAESGMTDVLVFHGATDAPTVDVFESSVPAGTIVDDLAYGEFAGYLPLSTLDYVLDIQDETGTTTVASFSAPLQTLSLEETALTVLASGFLSPEGEEAAFGLWVALPAGGDLVELPPVGSTNVENALDGKIKMYPNPATDFVTINFEDATNGNVNIYNIAGQMIYNKSFSQQSYIQLNIESLFNGMYIVEVRTEKGSFNTKLQIAK